MKKCQSFFISLLVGLMALSIGIVLLVYTLDGTAKQNKPTMPSHVNALSRTAFAPRGPSAPACGSWSSGTSTTGSYITLHYGEIRNCSLVGSTWLITTLGNSSHNGIIATYECSSNDATCLNATSNHPVTGWKFHRPPYPGGVTLLAFEPSNPNIAIIDNAGHQIDFNVQLNKFIY